MSQVCSNISACIIALNEEDRIGDCIQSLDFCDEIIVVDSHSSDRTREIAADSGARVIERDWPGYVDQKEFTIRQATHDWVLCVDADERISDVLRGEIIAIHGAGFPEYVGWSMPRCSSYLGKFIRHGTWYPDRQLRLFDRRRGHWGGHKIHEHVVLDGTAGKLSGDLLHHPYRDFSDHMQTIETYTTIMAEGLHARGQRARLLKIVLNPTWRFLRFYFVKRGFLDGWRGLVMAYMEAHYCRLKYTKLLVMQRSTRD